MEQRLLVGMPDDRLFIMLGIMLFGWTVPRREAIDLVHATLDRGADLPI